MACTKNDVPGLTILTDAIDGKQEAKLLEWVDQLPKEKFDPDVPRRIYQMGYAYNYKTHTVSKEKIDLIPEWILGLRPELSEAQRALCKMNQVIVNVYKPGQRIGAHVDAKDWGNLIAGLSLGSDGAIVFRSPANEATTVQLPRRSLMLMQDEARWAWTHELHHPKAARDRRVSFTFRSYQPPPPPA